MSVAEFPSVGMAGECAFDGHPWLAPMRRVPCEFTGHPLETLCGADKDNKARLGGGGSLRARIC